MSLGDVLLIFGLLLAHGIAMPGLAVTWGLLFPRVVARSRSRLAQTPGRCFLLGLGALAIGAILVRLAFLPGMVLGWFGLALLLAFASLGAAGLAALMGERLRTASPTISPTGALLRGAVALELAVVVPVIGWFAILPLCTVAMLGAASFALLRREPRVATSPPLTWPASDADTTPTPLMPVQLPTNPATWAETGGWAMRTTRREFLSLSGLAAAAAILSACTSPDPIGRAQTALLGDGELAPWSPADAATWRALGRLTFGPRPDEVARATELGLSGWIEEQLAPEGIADRDADLRIRRFDTLALDPSALAEVRDDNARRELQSATLLRAVYSKRQLHEVMVDFWSDHFSISTQKGDCAWLKTVDDREVIRPHALGTFRDLLAASMPSPAMLFYLDNQENHAGKPNENYARELLELHTLGVGAGYSQRDVQEVARCLTGWTIERHRQRGRFAFDAATHDDGAKTVLAVPLPAGGGVRDGERICELLLAHPALPRFIAHKLVRRFVADDPSPGLVAAVADTFTQTDGDIKATLRAIFRSPEFVALAGKTPKFKRPFSYVAGALRQLGATTAGDGPLLEHLARMGQPLFQWPTPDGFPDHPAAWSAALLARWRFALALATEAIPGTRLDLGKLAAAAGAVTLSDWLDRLATLLLGHSLPLAARDALLPKLGPDDEYARRAVIAILLASPGYQWR